MKEAAARAIAEAVPDDELSPEYVLPDGFNPIVVKRVAAAVRDAWEKGEGAK